jgi:O-antigen ligase
MLSELRKARYPLELALLVAFCFFLPLVELWKNVALVGYAIAWVMNRSRDRDFGGAWRISDTLVALWIGAAYLAAAFPGLEGRALAKTGDVLASALLFWMVARAGYAQRERYWLFGTLVASTLLGLAIGYGRLWSGLGKSGSLQLYSVGHVNHTAIYLAIMLGLCASWLFARWHAWPRHRGMVALAANVLVLVSLVVTASRGAVGVGFVMLLLLALAWWPRWRTPMVGSIVAIAVMTSLVVGFGGEVFRKQQDNAAAQNVLSFRDGIWRTGFAAWEKFPWFGVGKDNFGKISHQHLRQWRSEAGKDYDQAQYFPYAHAHSLYVNTLTERGAVGFLALAAVLLAALAALLRHRPRPDDDDSVWLAWGGAAGAWIVTAGVGTVNTTLHHEHGLLAALLLALWLQTLPRAR